ncbi:DUF5615 family PIN-like protein [Crocosphaera sp. XPORK-15E]|uniref:DUF5615 family PIN-like protein n=1 Tax=Crocosphaera sp. XPORK-15E TaxID=3110247 RepID=UPI002B1F3DDD|nr:DUF5615 family PIN-like protein [Crocosphaera sp. XPORK-15E]MEA5533230.1 DUF5615 family PIN-like protein [Crocosphaera sp. XPORK-15E]
MSKISLYMDEDSTTRSLFIALKSRGIDVITALDANSLGFTDEEQLRKATSLNRVLYSYNIRDFYALHTYFLEQEITHAGIILVQQQKYSIGELMRGILKLINSKSSQNMINKIEFLSSWIN